MVNGSPRGDALEALTTAVTRRVAGASSVASDVSSLGMTIHVAATPDAADGGRSTAQLGSPVVPRRIDDAVPEPFDDEPTAPSALPERVAMFARQIVERQAVAVGAINGLRDAMGDAGAVDDAADAARDALARMRRSLRALCAEIAEVEANGAEVLSAATNGRRP